MINIHQQLCTFEQALKMKELGIAQTSLFYYHVQHLDTGPVFVKCDNGDYKSINPDWSELRGKMDENQLISAWNASELFEILLASETLVTTFFSMEYSSIPSAHLFAYVLLRVIKEELVSVKQVNQIIAASLTTK